MFRKTATDLSELREYSKELREALGVFATEEQLERYANTSPIEALRRVLFGKDSTKALNVPSDVRGKDARIVETRKAAWNL